MYKKLSTFELFPKVVLKYNLNRHFTKSEVSILNEFGNHTYRNVGNHTSGEKHVLDAPELEHLRRNIIECADDYLESIYKPKNKLKLYVTISWINVNGHTNWHHLHRHPNSFLSGVLYLSADNDSITFQDDIYRQIFPDVRDYTKYNSMTWKVPVETGDIVIFPSHLQHMVEANRKNIERVSLSFNIFVKGELGSSDFMTELKL